MKCSLNTDIQYILHCVQCTFKKNTEYCVDWDFKLVYQIFAQPYVTIKTDPILSLIPSFSLPDVMCDPTDLIWRKGTSFEAMTGRTAPSSDGLLAENFWGFPRL